MPHTADCTYLHHHCFSTSRTHYKTQATQYSPSLKNHGLDIFCNIFCNKFIPFLYFYAISFVTLRRKLKINGYNNEKDKFHHRFVACLYGNICSKSWQGGCFVVLWPQLNTKAWKRNSRHLLRYRERAVGASPCAGDVEPILEPHAKTRLSIAGALPW